MARPPAMAGGSDPYPIGEPDMATNEVPFMDLSRMLEQFKLPGVDVNALVEARRHDRSGA